MSSSVQLLAVLKAGNKMQRVFSFFHHPTALGQSTGGTRRPQSLSLSTRQSKIRFFPFPNSHTTAKPHPIPSHPIPAQPKLHFCQIQNTSNILFFLPDSLLSKTTHPSTHNPPRYSVFAAFFEHEAFFPLLFISYASSTQVSRHPPLPSPTPPLPRTPYHRRRRHCLHAILMDRIIFVLLSLQSSWTHAEWTPFFGWILVRRCVGRDGVT
jgi:hypothetical protein